MKKINGDQTVYELIQQHPALKEVLVELGFTPLNNERMLNTVGRVMTLNKGAKQIGLSKTLLIEGLKAADFYLKD